MRFVERLLLLLFVLARAAFMMQGVAFGCACIAVLSFAPPDSAPWFRSAMISAGLISGAFFAGGLLLIAARRSSLPHTSGHVEPTWLWRALLGLSLVVLPVLAAAAVSGLLPLWRRVGVHLAAIGFWGEMTRPGQYSGLVMLPILLALFVPVLLTATASFSIGFPVTLLPLLAGRSRLFVTLFAMGTVCQATLVLTGWLAADAFAMLAEQALAAMGASGDAEVLQLAGELRSATAVLSRTATTLVAPVLGLLAWLVFLRRSGAAAAFFAEAAIGVDGRSR